MIEKYLKNRVLSNSLSEVANSQCFSNQLSCQERLELLVGIFGVPTFLLYC